jgi:hypothetical protein
VVSRDSATTLGLVRTLIGTVAPTAAESALLPEGRQTARVTVLEFWPDYGSGPLWTDDGKPADLTSLGMGPHLVEQVTAWNAAYEESKVPIEGAGDAAWLREGSRLLHEIRAALGTKYQVVVTEPWWGEDST